MSAILTLRLQRSLLAEVEEPDVQGAHSSSRVEKRQITLESIFQLVKQYRRSQPPHSVWKDQPNSQDLYLWPRASIS